MSNEQTATPEAEIYTTRFDEHGHEVAHFSMVRTGGPKAIVYALPDQAIPIVFVPGIMGTPLVAVKDKSPVRERDGKWAWFPDDLKWMGVSISGVFKAVRGDSSSGFSYLKPEEKSRMLKVDNTRVPRPDEADLMGLEQVEWVMHGAKKHHDAEYRRRGWGSVILGNNGYGRILHYLDYHLNHVYHEGKLVERWKTKTRHIDDLIHGRKVMPATISLIRHQERDVRPFTLDDLKCMGDWYFPVYAAGYNWLDSNDNSAQHLATRIDEILQDCRGRLGFKCEKVILVTHSMGGLVARMCAKKYSDKIMGVVHGVQPINGAGSAYHRVVSGWDGTAGLVFGMGPKDLTPIFANAGPLQLLPNKQYGTGWLTINQVSGGTVKRLDETLLKLPLHNPYKEIYQNTTSWWRVVNPELVMPESTEIADKKKFYRTNINKAEDFHDDIAGYFHPTTYVHYGQSQQHKTWYTIDINVSEQPYGIDSTHWPHPLSKEAMLNGKMVSPFGFSSNTAEIEVSPLRKLNAVLSGRDDAGDATVPASSMHLENNERIKAVTVIDNIEHGGSYNDELSRLATLYGICRIVNTHGAQNE